MLRPRFSIVVAVALAGVSSVAVAQQALRPQRVEVAGGLGGPHLLRADTKGRLYDLRGDPFEVLRILRSRPAKEIPVALANPPRELPVEATPSRDGSRWLLRTRRELLFAGPDETQALPEPPWMVWSTGMLGDTPLAAVQPVLRGPLAPGFRPPRDTPLILAYDGKRWSTFATERIPPGDYDPTRDARNNYVAYRALRFAASARGVWTANQYLYRVRKYGPTGKVELDLTLADAAPTYEEDEEAIAKQSAELATQAARTGRDPGARPAVSRVFAARPILLDLTEGRDGRLYVLVAAVGGHRLTLDRFTPATQLLERSPLELDLAGPASLAATADGLWIAGRARDGATWSLPWEWIEKASWKPVEGVEIDGHPAPARAAP